jgi:DNA-binding MurR/RpiR family transcriptional regulator
MVRSTATAGTLTKDLAGMSALTLEERIKEKFASMTPSERSIAGYMLGNIHLLPFENAADIATSVGVSQMTVGRFLRSIGYHGIGNVKKELRDSALSSGLKMSDRLDRLRGNADISQKVHQNLQREVNALVSVYEALGTPMWEKAIGRLVDADTVFVTGFQTLSGMGSDFAARLQYLRPGVVVLDGQDGTFADLLAGRSTRPCLVLFEMRRYTKCSQLLARKAQELGVSLIILCDRHCHWPSDHSDTVFTVNTDSSLFWDNQTPFVCLTNLMMDQVARRLKRSVTTRVKSMTDLQDEFGAFVG